MNIDILEISELKWTGMGKFNSDDHYIYYCGARIPQKKWSSHDSQQENPKCSIWTQSQKNRIISVRFHGKPFNITVIQVCALTSNAEEAEVEWFYEDLQDLLKIHPQKM